MTDYTIPEASAEQDYLLVHHPDGTVDKVTLPTEPGSLVKLGRELDNTIVLPDPRISRHHAQIRRTEDGRLEIIDLGSANGTLVGAIRAKPDQWYSVPPGQMVHVADTRLLWEQPITSRSTVGMMPVVDAVRPAANPRPTPVLWWGVGLLVLIALIALAVMLLNNDKSQPQQATVQPTMQAQAPADITQQTPQISASPLATLAPTPAGIATPNLGRPLSPALPAFSLEQLRFLPVISGALFDTNHVYLIVTTRVTNLGDEPFTVSTDQFHAQTATGERIKELGQEFVPSEFKRLGVADRFDNLLLGSGGEVSEELVFYLEPKSYNLMLYFTPPGFDPLTANLGTLSADQQLANLLGTPSTGTAIVSAVVTPTMITPTVTPPVVTSGAARSVSAKTLAGTIAYADFNGTTYDIYFGDVTNGTAVVWRGESSQPIFSSDGSRIAYHSWANNSRGLIVSALDHTNGFLVGTFIEDQLPALSPDAAQLLFLSRRTGTRQSQLYAAPTNQERPEAQFLVEGEYPSWHKSGMVVFKGWGNTGKGLRVASISNLSEFRPLTDFDGDTAPSVSPDGKKIVFMSNRENNWDIYVINSDGSELTRLTSDESMDGLPTWSPDGKAIAFVSNRGGPWAIWAMTLNGTGMKKLFTYQGSPDGFVASEPTHDTTRGWAEERISWTE